MIEGSCHCGAVRWHYDRQPDEATVCNCTICRRYGVIWAYDRDGSATRVAGDTWAYTRGDAELGFHFCPSCGCVMFWRRQVPAEGGNALAVNLRMAEPEVVADIPIRRFDGLGPFEERPRDGRCVADFWA